MKFRHIIPAALFFLAFCTRLYAQQQPAFHHLTVENGLSQNAVITISQDNQGFIWLGTSNGLNRYDGYRVKVYQSRASDSTTIMGSNVISILNDSHKNMWIGTYNGLSKYQPETDRFKRIRSPRGTLSFHSLYEDRKGRIWAGTNTGLYRIDPATDQLESADSLLTKHPSGAWSIRAILEDRNGLLWIGTTEGLFCIRQSGNTIERTFYQHDPQNASSISGDFITTIEEDLQGRIWIGTHINGLNQYDSRTGQFKQFMHQSSAKSIINNNIRKLLVDKEGHIWVGTQEGISVLDDAGNSLDAFQQNDNNPESLSQNSVHSLYQDASGNIWAGTYFGGVNYTYSLNTQFSVLRKKDQADFLNNNVISSITEDEKNNLWIGTEGGGLNYYDRVTGLFHIYKHVATDTTSIGSNLIKIVYRDWQGQIWCGTHGGGLNLFDPVKKDFKRFLFRENDPIWLNEEVVSIYEDGKGRLWVGTTLGVKVFNKIPRGLEPFTGSFNGKSPLSAVAYYILEDDKNRLWFCTSEGLYVLENEQFRKVSSDIANCIQQNKRSQLWIGIHQGGLARYDENTQQLEYYNQPGKIGNRNILGILEDDQQNLWLSSDNGLLKFNPKLEQLQQFTVSDGLAGNAFNYNSFFRDTKGEFFFGGFNGITHFYPEKIHANQKSGKIVFTGLKLFNDAVEPGDSTTLLKNNISGTTALTLKHNQDAITIEFALLNFIKSNKNSYAYQLEGYDKDWIYTSIPSASYVNLPTGTYHFLVKGANNDGVWSDPISLKVTVLPPFWLTWWAYCLYILFAAGIIFLTLRYFILGALLKKEEELHQVKLNFFTNISHEIRTHLTLIMTPVDRMLDSDEPSSFLKQQLGSVKHNANRLLKLVNELMDFRKAETANLKLVVQEHDLIPFLEDIYTSFRDISIKKSIATSFIYDGDSLPLYFDKEQLEKVFFNLLTNAIKFTPENGHIWLQVTENDKEVTITVTDNGRGIAPEYIDKVFTNFFQVADHGFQNTGYGIGLALSKNIVLLHKGNIEVQSTPSAIDGMNKTVFTVTLLKGNKHFDSGQVKAGDTKQEFLHKQTETALLPEEADVAGVKKPVILIVEDNPELRTLVKETFQHHYTVAEAGDGMQGLEMATSLMPDIIVSDVMMPLMDGVELCHKLKTDERTSHIPVILLTAKSTQSDQVSGLENGADMYITKPFSTRVLELNVRNLLVARERIQQQILQQVSAYPAISFSNGEKPPTINSTEQEFLQRVIQVVEEHMDNPAFGVEMLSRKVAMSTPALYKKIKAVSKMSVNDFVKSLRLKKAAQLLSEKQLTVSEIAYTVGYNDRKYFSQEFKKQFGKTPSEYASIITQQPD
ncbi:MAG: two-component regulator propeller domain-containing protein [Chitinophagaceae bacterium]